MVNLEHRPTGKYLLQFVRLKFPGTAENWEFKNKPFYNTSTDAPSLGT